MRFMVLGMLMAPSLACAWTHSQSAQGADTHWNVPTVSVSIDSARASKTLSAEQVEAAVQGAIDAWSSLPEAKVVVALAAPQASSDDDKQMPTFNGVRFRKK